MNAYKSIRVIFVGDSAVGKTTLLLRRVSNIFKEEREVTSIVQFHDCVEILDDGTEVKLELWDTAGQERYRSLSSVFYRGAQVALLCFDISSEQDNENNIKMWIKQVTDTQPDCKIILVGTKYDLVNDTSKSSAVKKIHEYAQKCGLEHCFITSSRTSEGVEDLFQEVATIVQPTENHTAPAPENLSTDSSCNC